MLNRNFKRQRGLTIIELIIGLAVGLLVVGGAITMYVQAIRSSNETLRSSKLNQEISALMAVMVDDIRRAGYWNNVSLANGSENPFSQENATVLTVIDDMTNNAAQGATGQGSCLVYAYDATYLGGNVGGTLETTDLFGFRLNGTVVQMRQTGVVDGVACVGGTCNSCTNGTWQNVTDPNLIEITALSFDLANSQCINAMEPDGEDNDADGTIDEADEADCYAVVPANGSGDATAETRELLISVSGRLANDTSTQMTATQTIKVRNDHLRLR
ncbi:MAG: prepilin-type N-terminal cleavage/methylation domain-containing protein [Gammaproteobacteria bacterium]|jgi:type IV pilus assembly protein PilW